MTPPVSEVIRDPEVLRNVRGMLDTICDRWNAVNHAPQYGAHFKR